MWGKRDMACRVDGKEVDKEEEEKYVVVFMGGEVVLGWTREGERDPVQHTEVQHFASGAGWC